MLIRPISRLDIPRVAAMFRALAEEFIVHDSAPDAAARFIDENSETGLLGFIEKGIVYHVADVDGGVAGFIAVRDQRHLFHMFVDKRYHRQGIARCLWDVARQGAIDAGNEGIFTVNSSNYALPVYIRFGFVRTAPTQESKGLRYNPMQLGGSITPFIGAP